MHRAVVLAALVCALAAAQGATTPQQVHVAFAGRDATGESNGMSVSWATIPSNTKTSTVLYGTSPSALNSTATGTAVSYLENGGYHHHVVLTNLQLETTYYYVCGDEAGGFSPIYSFNTARPATTKAYPISVASFGDWGYGVHGNAVATFNRLQAWDAADGFDFVLHSGDISYADDAFLHDPLHFSYETVYNSWGNWVANISRSHAYMVLPGNHESECHSPICLLESKYRDTLNNFTAYNARFRMPAEESNAHGSNMFYSFNFGPAHWVAFDAETDYPNAPEEHHGDSGVLPAGGFVPDGEQLKWLEADLAAANASRADRPFIIVTSHRPIYTLHNCDSNGVPNSYAKVMQDTFEGLMHKYGVDLYLSGHVHAYGRTKPVYNNVPTPGATVHAVIGGAGCDEMKGDTVDAVEGPQPVSKIPWAAFADDSHYGVGKLTFTSPKNLVYTWYESSTGTVLDKFSVSRE